MQNSGMENGQNLSIAESQIKILVVDDHPNTANMLARALSRLGSHAEVVSATSGREALQHVENGAADILITDMMMPEMTGMELVEKLNEDPSLSPSVTFLLTAHDSTGVREIAQRLNMKDVIAKPVHPEQICELISQTIHDLKHSKPVKGEATVQKQLDLNLNRKTKLENLNINKLLWGVAKKFQLQADIKNQILVVGKIISDLTVRGNAVQLHQALCILVWSAINNTPKDGSVILSSETESDRVKILVRDTGYGNNNGFQDNEISDQNLAVVKSIAEGHGGNMTVESEVGKGTCVTISIPLMAENQQAIN